MTYSTSSEHETMEIGKSFASSLLGGEVVLMIGDLGAGKTTFVKGVAEEFGVRKAVTSPTFVIMKIYQVKSLPSPRLRQINQKLKVKSFGTINLLVHIDTYRGLGFQDLENIGAVEYFGRKDCVSFVEWGAGLEDYLKEKNIPVRIIKIKSIEQNKREIEIV